MSEFQDLYQQVILDHNQRPRNFHALEGKVRRSEGHNPLCGDRLTVYLDVQDGQVRDVAFVGDGCAISKASASMMTEAVKGRTREEAEALFRVFHGLLTGDQVSPDDPRLGKLVVFAGVRDYPVRVKCATLAWHTLRAALEDRNDTITTE
ncbi:MAG TPA: SUF system NifU family Fe-S cluster assembly protein [Candidatus Cryosericum sp.]|nr:SUF system NifU family Fe-S cluster assembly protein [Candidatus Cryosericum sp.]